MKEFFVRFRKMPVDNMIEKIAWMLTDVATFPALPELWIKLWIIDLTHYLKLRKIILPSIPFWVSFPWFVSTFSIFGSVCCVYFSIVSVDVRSLLWRLSLEYITIGALLNWHFWMKTSGHMYVVFICMCGCVTAFVSWLPLIGHDIFWFMNYWMHICFHSRCTLIATNCTQERRCCVLTHKMP